MENFLNLDKGISNIFSIIGADFFKQFLILFNSENKPKRGENLLFFVQLLCIAFLFPDLKYSFIFGSFGYLLLYEIDLGGISK